MICKLAFPCKHPREFTSRFLWVGGSSERFLRGPRKGHLLDGTGEGKQVAICSALVRWRKWRQRGQHVREVQEETPHSFWGLCHQNKELPVEWLTPATIPFSVALPESVDGPRLCSRLWADSGSAAPVLLFWASGLRRIPHLQHAATWRTQRNHGRLSHTVPSHCPATQRRLCHAC